MQASKVVRVRRWIKLGFGIRYPIFPKIPQPILKGLCNGLSPGSLGNAYQGNGIPTPTGPTGCLGYPIIDFGQLFGQRNQTKLFSIKQAGLYQYNYTTIAKQVKPAQKTLKLD
jgi:hypothetical protein